MFKIPDVYREEPPRLRDLHLPGTGGRSVSDGCEIVKRCVECEVLTANACEWGLTHLVRRVSNCKLHFCLWKQQNQHRLTKNQRSRLRPSETCWSTPSTGRGKTETRPWEFTTFPKNYRAFSEKKYWPDHSSIPHLVSPPSCGLCWPSVCV